MLHFHMTAISKCLAGYLRLGDQELTTLVAQAFRATFDLNTVWRRLGAGDQVAVVYFPDILAQAAFTPSAICSGVRSLVWVARLQL